MNSIKWILFDVGSTLIDETEAYNHRIRDAIQNTNITLEQFNKKRVEFAKQNLKSDLEALKYFGLVKTPWHKEDEIPYPDAQETLNLLYAKGYKIGVIANQSLGTADRLEKWGLLKYISVVVASAEIGFEKPDERIFKRALEMANCSAHDCVMIGDRLDNDILPAKKIGMKTIWIKQGFARYSQPENLECQADYTVGNLTELTDLL